MAQALKDLALDTVVQTVDCDEGLVATARANVEAAGLGEYVRFHVEDSLAFLSRLTAQGQLGATPRPPLTPRWAYEPWVWEDELHADGAVRDLVDGYRQRDRKNPAQLLPQ